LQTPVRFKAAHHLLHVTSLMVSKASLFCFLASPLFVGIAQCAFEKNLLDAE
jgi:hypothetical protein